MGFSLPPTEGTRMSDEIEVTDRYDALGMPRPDPRTVCRGQCEGTGWIPVYLREGDTRIDPNLAVPTETESDRALVEAWYSAEASHPTSDGWHFVPCPRCNGTGKRAG